MGQWLIPVEAKLRYERALRRRDDAFVRLVDEFNDARVPCIRCSGLILRDDNFCSWCGLSKEQQFARRLYLDPPQVARWRRAWWIVLAYWARWKR